MYNISTLLANLCQVTEHHTELLQQAERAEGLVGSLQYVRGGLDELDSSLAKWVV